MSDKVIGRRPGGRGRYKKGQIIGLVVFSLLALALCYGLYKTNCYLYPIFWPTAVLQLLLMFLFVRYVNRHNSAQWLLLLAFAWPFIPRYFFRKDFPDSVLFGAIILPILFLIIIAIVLSVRSRGRKKLAKETEENLYRSLLSSNIKSPTQKLIGKVIFFLLALYVDGGFIYWIVINKIYQNHLFWIFMLVQAGLICFIYGAHLSERRRIFKIIAVLASFLVPFAAAFVFGAPYLIPVGGILIIIYLNQLACEDLIHRRLAFDSILPRELPSRFGNPVVELWSNGFSRVSKGADIIFDDRDESIVWIQESQNSIEWTISKKSSSEIEKQLYGIRITIRQKLDRKKRPDKSAFWEAQWKNKDIYFDLRTFNLDEDDFYRVLASMI